MTPDDLATAIAEACDRWLAADDRAQKALRDLIEFCERMAEDCRRRAERLSKGEPL